VALSQKPTGLRVGKSDLADAELQRQDEVHQSDHERHGDEETITAPCAETIWA
jgi:hypothetical protein